MGFTIYEKPCEVCGKVIRFTPLMSSEDYVYKKATRGDYKYYCSWSHYREGIEKLNLRTYTSLTKT